MDDKAHIGFVDTHAKGDSGNDHLDVLHQEVVLRLRPCLGVEPRMIGGGLDVVGFQYL